MTNRERMIWNDLRPFSVGFDNIFDHFNLHLDNTRTVNYPPYNINKIDDFNWNIEIALAGFSKKDIDVSTAENQLTIKSVESDDKDEKDTIHRGISKRQFTRSFTLADDVVVNGAELKDGMLVLILKKLCLRKRNRRQLKSNNYYLGLLDRPI